MPVVWLHIEHSKCTQNVDANLTINSHDHYCMCMYIMSRLKTPNSPVAETVVVQHEELNLSNRSSVYCFPNTHSQKVLYQ